EVQARSYLKEFSATNELSGGGFAGVLSRQQAGLFKAVCDSAENARTTQLLETTTPPGGKAVVQDVEVRTIVTGIDRGCLKPPGTTNGFYYHTQTLAIGPAIEFLPGISHDYSSIQLAATPTFTGFVGYDEPAKSIPVYTNGKELTVQIPRPRYRIRTTTANMI